LTRTYVNFPLVDRPSHDVYIGLASHPQAEFSPVTRCDHCGADNDAVSKYCGECGKGLDPTKRPVTTPPFPARVSDQRVSGTVCPQCGQPLSHHRRSRPLEQPLSLSQLDDTGQVVGRHQLKREETSVGRVDADITFSDDPFVSPIHAQFSVRGHEVYIRDLGSRNGTWYFVDGPYLIQDGDLLLVGSQVIRFRRLGYPGPHPPEQDQTRRLGSSTPGADIASLTQLRGDGSARDVLHLSPGRDIEIGRERGDWVFPYDLSMSGKHAEVLSRDADFVVVDAGSRNGVGVAVRGEIRLAPGARILVGDKILRIDSP
jgi:pSer/pThr/pTyr-binding forkhead associated (FHA) protein